MINDELEPYLKSQAIPEQTEDVKVVVAKNFDEMGEMLREYLAKNPKAKVLFAYGCTAHTVAEKRLPNRQDLDKIITFDLPKSIGFFLYPFVIYLPSLKFV